MVALPLIATSRHVVGPHETHAWDELRARRSGGIGHLQTGAKTSVAGVLPFALRHFAAGPFVRAPSLGLSD
jgi:hypothetical protein